MSNKRVSLEEARQDACRASSSLCLRVTVHEMQAGHVGACFRDRGHGGWCRCWCHRWMGALPPLPDPRRVMLVPDTL